MVNGNAYMVAAIFQPPFHPHAPRDAPHVLKRDTLISGK